jgi:hypothetical protein
MVSALFYSTILSIAKLYAEWWGDKGIAKDLEESIHSLIKLLSQHIPGHRK